MAKPDTARIRELLERVARLAAAEEWTGDLNPAQSGALTYLARANRFSRSPSHVAEYLCTTRGTASQTLKALERKGFVKPIQSMEDKRSISYDVTRTGHAALDRESDLDKAFAALSKSEAGVFETVLEGTLKQVLARRNSRSFGVCKTCRHHQRKRAGGYCTLLEVALAKHETEELCHEHSSAA